MRARGGRRRAVGAVAAAALATATLGACSVTVDGAGATSRAGGAPPASSAPGPGAGSGAASCPSSYLAPPAGRPKISLVFRVGSDLTTVAGTEHVAFTPDKQISELVFRLSANTKPTVAAGNSITVTSARADHGGGAPRYTAANAAASTQGGLLRIPFAAPVAAGTTVSADIGFRLTLGEDSFDRFGRTGSGPSRFAWFASAQPLLAWQNGYGWHTEDMLDFTAESATSEAADTDLTVHAPAGEVVIASGNPTTPSRSGTTSTWHSHLTAARDVSVAVGPFRTHDTTVNGVALRVGAASAAEADSLTPEFTRAITQLAKRFGPFPFPSLAVARVPAQGGGIEYPGSILMLDSSRLVSVHETAHQWFYAMVGDSQAQHPWLDEAFASYAEQLVDGDPPPAGTLQVPGAVDRSAESYGNHANEYYFITYDKGAAALHAARAAAGSARFDAAIRCYVNANAWRIAVPADLAAALAKLPAAVAVLKRAGALP